MSKKKNENINPEVTEAGINDVPETAETTNVEPVSKTVKGRVANCRKLNVRAKAEDDAEILGQVKVDAILEINPDNSNKRFYAVTTEEGMKGYCMKKYVKIVR